MEAVKKIIRSVLKTFKLDLTKNLVYDRLTEEIIKSELSSNSSCIDVGCHKGEVLDEMLKVAPHGVHYAFEPIPLYFNDLIEKYPDVKLYNIALSDNKGNSNFQFVKSDPAFSGFKKRSYLNNEVEIDEIQVQTDLLDNLIPSDQKVDLIKIDVEGAEFQVLKGAKNIIDKWKPIVVFEFGLGAADYYGTEPKDVFEYFNTKGMGISTLKLFLKQRKSLSLEELIEMFQKGTEYYFVAFSLNRQAD